MTEDLARRVEAYRRGLAIAKEMLSRGLINEQDYAKIDTMLTKKHGLSLDSIFR